MVKILEATLCDGSYAIDFQFTRNDTEIIRRALDKFGFDYIEIVHRLGLGASVLGKGKAFCSDEEYFSTAANAIKNAKWDSFFIPEIGDYSQIDLAVDQGMKYISIGTNINEIENSLPYMRYAKKKGLEVFNHDPIVELQGY